METEEKNKLIAEFMELAFIVMDGETSYIKDSQHVPYYELDYHSDWNWLMGVIKKIADETGFELVSGFDYCYWNHYGENPFEDTDDLFSGYSDIANIHHAVVEFIKWYNKQPKT